MIATSDIEDIILECCSVFGITPVDEVYLDDKTGTGLDEEVYVVHVHAQNSGKIWEPCAVDVNFCVPDFKSGKRNIAQLKYYENSVNAMFKDSVCGEYEDTPYLIEKISVGIEEEPKIKAHYVNLKVNFKTLNTLQT